MTGSGEEEGRNLKFILCPLSGSNIRVENRNKGVLHYSSLDNNVGTCSTGCGSGLGFSDFASLHGGFSGFSERIDLNKKEGWLGMKGKRVPDTSRKNQKRAALEEDPDRLPEQESFIQLPGANNGGHSVGKRSKERYNGKDPFGDHHGLDVSKPGSQSTSAPNNPKHLLLATGWTVVSRQGICDLLYVSPSGSAYGSLAEALKAFYRDASEFREKECGSYQSGYTGGCFGDSDIFGHSSGSKLVAKNTHEGKGTVDQMAEIGSPVKHVNSEDMLLHDQDKIKEFLTNPVEMVSSGVHNVVACSKVNEKAETHIKNGSFSGETKKLNYSTLVMSKANHHNDVEIQKCDNSIGVTQSELTNVKPVPVDDQIGIELREDEDLLKLSKHEVFMGGNLLLQKPQTYKETREEALLMSDETRCKQVFDVVAVDEKVNQENRKPDGCSRRAVRKDNQSIVNINQDGKLHGVRRSGRINGRHVPVYTELDIDIWDDIYYLDSCDSVNTTTTDVHLGTQAPHDEISNEASPMPKEIRYKEVNEASTASIMDEKALLEKQKPDEEAPKKPSAVREELRSVEIHKQLVIPVEDEKGKTSPFVDLLSQDMLPLEWGTGNESDNEVLPMLRERRYRELHDILESCMADGEAKSSSDCSSEGAQKLDSRRASVVNNGEDRDGDMHQHSERVELRRSKRIDGKHVPVDGELDFDTWVFDDYIDSSGFVDDRVERKDKEKSANSNSEMVSIVLGLPAAGFVHNICRKNVKARSAYSISEMVNILVGLPAPGWLKQTGAMKSDHQKPRNQEPVECTAIMKSGNQKPRNQEQLDSNGIPCIHEKVLKKCLGVKTPLAEKVSSLSLNNATEALKQTAMWKSDNQNTRNQEQNQEQSEQSAMRRSDNQTPKKQEQLDSNSPLCMHEKKKSDGVKTLVAEKGSPSLLNNGTKALITEKRPPLSLSKRKPVGGGYSNGKKKKKRSGGCGLVVRRTGKGDGGEHIVSETKRSILSWLIDSGTLAESDKVVYKIKNSKGNVTKGSITRGGIRCNCCRKVWSLLEFEAHADSNIHQPWINTCLISGKSLMQCQSEAWEKEKKKRKVGFQTVGSGDADPSDDACGICADGGHLICCDGCLSTFHQECVMLKSLPEGSWYCSYCRCAFCKLADSGHDILSQNFSMSSCNQCGCKYHRDCVVEKDEDEIFSNSLSFCGENCRKNRIREPSTSRWHKAVSVCVVPLAKGLYKRTLTIMRYSNAVATGLSDILGVSNPLDRGFSWTLLKRLDEDEDVGSRSDQRLSFIMGCNIKLALALSALDECFVPLVDTRTGLDMIVQAVYNCGSNYNRLNCERFYTMVLEKDEEIVSVATLRLHGTRLAEMPFIGTRPIYRRKGMCRRLLNSIEKMLSSLHVEKLIIPAIPELLGTWMTSFSFTPLESSHREEIRNLSIMLFADTILLQKSLCNSETNEASGICLDKM